MMYGYGGMWGGMIFFWLILFVGLIMFIFWLSRQSRTQSGMDVARERYAKGEITKKDFEEMQKTIRGST